MNHSLALIVSSFACFCMASMSPGQPDQDAATDPGRVPLPRLVELMKEGIDVKSPNSSPFTEEGVNSPFDGSYDWHSCIIAHWALLQQARVNGDEDLGAWVMARLPIEVLEAETRRLDLRRTGSLDAGIRRRRDAQRSTSPYDEGWFCVLLSEVARRDLGDDTARLLALRSRVESRLMGILEESNFPENRGLRAKALEAGERRYCGFYESLLFTYLQLRWSRPVDESVRARLDTWRREKIEPNRAAIEAIDQPHGYDFLWVPALLALADDADGLPAAAPYQPPAFDGWPESVTIAVVHVLGMELSRVWPCAIPAASAEQARTYAERASSLVAREDLWATDFATCSHWMPQYLFIGEWLRAGRR